MLGQLMKNEQEEDITDEFDVFSGACLETLKIAMHHNQYCH